MALAGAAGALDDSADDAGSAIATTSTPFLKDSELMKSLGPYTTDITNDLLPDNICSKAQCSSQACVCEAYMSVFVYTPDRSQRIALLKAKLKEEEEEENGNVHCLAYDKEPIAQRAYLQDAKCADVCCGPLMVTTTAPLT